MNGATEATLAELLAVAQAMSANIVKLNNMFSQFQSGGGGASGGSAAAGNFVRALNPASLALGVLQGAVSAVGSVLSVMKDMVGHVISGLVKTASNLIAFSLQAALGTAKLSDFYNALRDVPLVGGLFSLFGKIVAMQETILGSYQSVAKSGASFSGNLMNLQQAAARSYMSIESFSKVILENGPMFASAAGGMQAGIEKFVGAQNLLMSPSSPFAKSILGLGYTAEETAAALASTIKSQGIMNKQGAMTQQQLAKSTEEYLVFLDGLAKATGKRRDQVQAEVEKAEADVAFNMFLDTIKDPVAIEKAKIHLAEETAKGGQAGREVAMNTIRGIMAPMNELQTQYYMINTNLSQQNQQARQLIFDGTVDKDKFKRLTGEISMRSMEASHNQFKQMNEVSQAVFLEQFPGAIAFAGSMRVAKASNFDYAAQQAKINKEQKDQQNGTAGSLALAQNSIKGFGTKILELIAIVINPLMKILTGWTNELEVSGAAIAKDLKPAVELFATWMTTVAWPAIKDFGTWVSKLFGDVMKAPPGERLTLLFKRLADGAKDLWKMVEKPLKEMWEKIQPVLVSMFEGLFNLMWSGFKKWLAGPSPEELAKQGQDRKNEKVEVKRDTAWWKTQATDQLASDPNNKNVTVVQINELAKKLQLEHEAELAREKARFAQAKPVEGKASGGMVRPGTYLVGEKGPELITTGSSGDVITNENLQALLKNQSSNNSSKALDQLNTLVAQLLRAQLQNNEYARKNVEATSALTGNLFV